MEKIATVPYATDKSYDFYSDKLVLDSTEITYDDISGFGYKLSHTKNSIDFIPTHNTSSFVVRMDIGKKKPFTFGRSATAPMFIKTGKQRTVDLIFVEVAKCIDALIAPLVFTKCLSLIQKGETLQVGSLTVFGTHLTKKNVFKNKALYSSDYGQTYIKQGQVFVADKKGKTFYACSLSEINAPLLPPILDTLFRSDG